MLVESVIDSLSLVEAGVGQAIALFGAHGVTEEHRDWCAFGVRRVVVALDADKTGHKAAPQVAVHFADLGALVEIVEWPEEDPNALLVRYGPEKLRQMVEALLRPASRREAVESPDPAVNGAPGAHGEVGESAVSGASPSLTASGSASAAAAPASGAGGGAVKKKPGQPGRAAG